MAGYCKAWHAHMVAVAAFGILCRLGDQIACVNGVSLLNVTHADAVTILKDSDHNIELVRK